MSKLLTPEAIRIRQLTPEQVKEVEYHEKYINACLKALQGCQDERALVVLQHVVARFIAKEFTQGRRHKAVRFFVERLQGTIAGQLRSQHGNELVDMLTPGMIGRKKDE